MSSDSGEGHAFREAMFEAATREGLVLSASQLTDLEIHYNLLKGWGRRMNLTAITKLREVVERHFLEGLVAGTFLAARGVSGRLVDLGSGNGFPGIPIRVACPSVTGITLVESSYKKAAFLRALLRELGWPASRVEVRRASSGCDLTDLPCDIFTTRGVAPLPFIREGFPFIQPGGHALLFMDRERLEKEFPLLPGTLELLSESPLPGRKTGLVLLIKR